MSGTRDVGVRSAWFISHRQLGLALPCLAPGLLFIWAGKATALNGHPKRRAMEGITACCNFRPIGLFKFLKQTRGAGLYQEAQALLITPGGAGAGFLTLGHRWLDWEEVQGRVGLRQDAFGKAARRGVQKEKPSTKAKDVPPFLPKPI